MHMMEWLAVLTISQLSFLTVVVDCSFVIKCWHLKTWVFLLGVSTAWALGSWPCLPSYHFPCPKNPVLSLLVHLICAVVLSLRVHPPRPIQSILGSFSNCILPFFHHTQEEMEWLGAFADAPPNLKDPFWSKMEGQLVAEFDSFWMEDMLLQHLWYYQIKGPNIAIMCQESLAFRIKVPSIWFGHW